MRSTIKILPTPAMTLSFVSGAKASRAFLLAMAIVSMLSMAFSAAAQEIFEVHGTVNLSVNNANNFGIVSGDNFSGLLTYNPSGPGVLIQGSGGPARRAQLEHPAVSLFQRRGAAI